MGFEGSITTRLNTRQKALINQSVVYDLFTVKPGGKGARWIAMKVMDAINQVVLSAQLGNGIIRHTYHFVEVTHEDESMTTATEFLEETTQVMNIMIAHLSGSVSLTIESSQLRLLLRHNSAVSVFRGVLSGLINVDYSDATTSFSKEGNIGPPTETVSSFGRHSGGEVVADQCESSTRLVLVVSGDITRGRLETIMISGLSSHIVQLITNRLLGGVKIDFIVQSNIDIKGFSFRSCFKKVTTISLFDLETVRVDTVESGGRRILGTLQTVTVPVIVSLIVISSFLSSLQPTAFGCSP